MSRGIPPDWKQSQLDSQVNRFPGTPGTALCKQNSFQHSSRAQEASRPSAKCASPLGHSSLTYTSHQALDQKEKKKFAQSLLASKLPNLLKPKNETTKVRFKLTSLSRLKRHVKGFLFLSFPKETLRIIIIKLVSSSTPTPQSGNTVSGCI